MRILTATLIVISVLFCSSFFALGQQPPYDNPPAVEPPYFRVRYEASAQPGELIFPVQYTVWFPQGVEKLRGIVVHQHGCGEGSCKSGQSGAFDLHWQALAQKHDCALLAPSYEQPQKADCQMWCDPRNGSAKIFQQSLTDLGQQSGHPELASVPWALWGHSGGGHWAGGMTLTQPEKVIAVWLRSGVPLLVANPERQQIKAHALPGAALKVPMMCNPGTKEGVTVKDGRFAKVWSANEVFFKGVRNKGGLIGVAVDPLTAHECGNQRYLAIPWLDACMSARLPAETGQPLREMPTEGVWLAPLLGTDPVTAAGFSGEVANSIWLPNEEIARAWSYYVKDTEIPDLTPPPAPTNIRLREGLLTWEAKADFESGISHFIIEHKGQDLATVPTQPVNRFGRPIFQGLQYSDTPAVPLVKMQFKIPIPERAQIDDFQVRAINTRGLKSP